MTPNILKAEEELFKIPLRRIVDLNQPLCKMAERFNWKHFEETMGELYCPDNGRPGVPTRLMVGLHYLKYAFDMSDDDVVAFWVQNPYWRYFCGGEYFEHEFPINPSSMSRWRKRIEKSGCKTMLKETIRAGLESKAIKKSDLARVNVDTTVQEKAIAYPTDARLYYKAIRYLVRYAKTHNIQLKQTFERVGKHCLLMQSRYAHSRKMKKAAKEVRKLRTYLGRLYLEIDRKTNGKFLIDERYGKTIEVIGQLLNQKRQDKNKIYSIHAPEVECIAKGKAHKKYEFGCKVGVVSSAKAGFILGIEAFHGNPFDGHTLSANLEQAERLTKDFVKIKQAATDGGYKEHDYQGDIQVIVSKHGMKKKNPALHRWMKRRSAIEPDIGHLKNDCSLDRNYLKGEEGDSINAILSGCGFNLRKLLRAFLRPVFEWINFVIKVNFPFKAIGLCYGLL